MTLWQIFIYTVVAACFVGSALCLSAVRDVVACLRDERADEDADALHDGGDAA